MKLGFCYKTKDGLYSIEMDEELLGMLKEKVSREIAHQVLPAGIEDIRKLGLMCDIWAELDDLPDKKTGTEELPF